MKIIMQQLEKLRNWFTGSIKVPVIIKEEKRGNGEKSQAEKIRSFWK